MWNLDRDTNKWLMTEDKLSDDVLGFYKQQLSSVRFYSKSLSGATYLPVNDSNDIYEVLTGRPNRDWYISFNGGSQYSNTLIPPANATPITSTSSYDFYTRNLSEYNLTLKTLFTPYRLLKDSFNNYIYVDVATTENLTDLQQFNDNRVIDGVRLKNGHRVLVKNQVTIFSLPNTIDPNSYFRGQYTILQNLGATIEYSYINEFNGVYEYRDGNFFKTNDLDDYRKSLRFSVVVKEGIENREKQFHLIRLRNRFYPSAELFDPFEFVEKKNWIIRNRVDYNNLFEINYYDLIKHSTQTYNIRGFTYSIPERTISVGEFGIIINFQNGVQNIINNKYKVNLRGISQTSTHYWICGDEGTLIKLRKHDFLLERVEIPKNVINTSLKSVSFYDDLKGVVVGDLNYVLVTNDGGTSWERIKFEEFDRFYYNKVFYYSPFSFFVGGNTGVFIEFRKDINGWNAIKRRISRFIDDEEEYILVDNINDLFYTKIENWGLTFSFSGLTTSNTKELLFIVGDDSKIIVHDLNDSIPEYDFLYLDFPNSYGDVRNITREGTSSNFYFTGIDEDNLISGLFKFELSNLQYIGVGNTYSNTVLSTVNPQFISEHYPNEAFDYEGQLIICGNNSLIKSATYSNFDFKTLDESFESRLKSKMLFLDYDSAAKLNFFTDEGDYRLPSNVEFIFGATSGYFLEFDQLVYGPTAPSFATQSEHNWFEYWQDSNMTFEYYSQNPVTNASKVVVSPKFRFSNDSGVLNVSTIRIDSNSILPLAPKILEPEIGRFNGFGMTAISTPSVSSDLYLYDYLMIANFGPTNSIEVGDVVRLDSNVVTSNFTVNKVITLSGNKYAYMFTEFNEAILRQIYDSTASITLTNLNTFISLEKLIEKHQHHPIYYGYKLSLSEKLGINSLLMDFNLGGTSSYTEWIFSGTFSDSPDFPTSALPGSPNTSAPFSLTTDYIGEHYIETPSVNNVENISFNFISTNEDYLPGTSSFFKIQGLSSSNWQDLYIYFIPDSLSGSLPNSVNLSVNYNYSKYRVSMFVAPTLGGPPKNISIDDINLSSSSEIIVSTYSYGISSSTMSSIIVEPKFNNLTAYYNLATNVNTNYLVSTMSYTPGFLKFGYTSTYNLLDYLESINDVGDPDPVFYANKEYYSMPHYLAVPMPGLNSLASNQVYIDYNGITYSNVPSNKMIFGQDMKLEWDSLLINTFVDIKLYDSPDYGTPSSITERLLIINKYRVDPTTLSTSFTPGSLIDNLYYVIEFDRSINLNPTTLPGNELYWCDILSRRKLSQISEDLQIINNIQRVQTTQDYNTAVNSQYGASFINFNRLYNFKINTDSYTKYMLADFETLDNLSAVVYTDYKNEFSMNITKLDQEFNIPIQNTANFAGNLFILCSQKHQLKTGDGVVLEFNGGTSSSQQVNPQYFGYQTVVVVNEYNFYCNIPYGNITLVGSDSGFVRYVRRDPFLNFQPVDLIEVGVDKRGRQSIELMIENTILSGDKFSLVSVDFEKFRFRLIDGLDLDIVLRNFSWILEAEISGAIIGQDTNGIIWYKGTWESGRWFGGSWISGAWVSGDWYNGNWFSKKIKDNFITVDIDDKSSDNLQSTWFNGRWYDGNWNSGTWVNGRWYGGNWNDGEWYKGIWNDGTWFNGLFLGGIWVTGVWQRGKFNCDNEAAYWLDGQWNGGDFENGMWYNGTWQERTTAARFGVKAYNSRTATWQGGRWLSGSFHSKENLDSRGLHQTSETHRYSIWKTGVWQSGDFYGGVVYNIDFKSGIWYGGILEDIQVIGFTGSTTTSENYFTLNGIFKFNIGDNVTLIDNQIGNVYSSFGSNANPKSYTVLYTTEDPVNKWTNVYVDEQITTSVLSPVDLGLRVVSTFRNCNWKSGIWTNGIYETGLWEGGIWYGGVFEQNATWM